VCLITYLRKLASPKTQKTSRLCRTMRRLARSPISPDFRFGELNQKPKASPLFFLFQFSLQTCLYLPEIKKTGIKPVFDLSGREDSNFRPLAPHASTLANCATPRNILNKELELSTLPVHDRDTLANPDYSGQRPEYCANV
jgi:hypothetical protein